MTIEIDDGLKPYLQAMLATGLFGATLDECADRLLAHAIEDKMRGPIANTIGRVMERQR